MWERFKQLLQDNAVFYSLVVVLTAVLAFGLGRTSANSYTPTTTFQQLPDFFIEPNDMSPVTGEVTASPATAVAGEVGQNFVASKNGKRYYPATCTGAGRIKDANRVYFASEPAAMAAGYSRATNCTWSE